MEPKWDHDGAKILQNRAKMGPRGPEMEPQWGQDGVKTPNKSKKKTPTQQQHGWSIFPPYMLIENEANMAPTWLPKWSQDGEQIDAKIYHFSDASWSRFFGWNLIDFRCQNGAKLVPKWDQKPMLTSKGDFSKNMICLFKENHVF